MPANPTAEAIRATLISPNESDRNLEAANVVDGLFAIARALERVADAIESGHGTDLVPTVRRGQGGRTWYGIGTQLVPPATPPARPRCRAFMAARVAHAGTRAITCYGE